MPLGVILGPHRITHTEVGAGRALYVHCSSHSGENCGLALVTCMLKQSVGRIVIDVDK